MVLLIILSLVIATLVAYSVWLYVKETPKTHCSSCGVKLTPENRMPKDGNTCAACYAVDMAPEQYSHYELHNIERI